MLEEISFANQLNCTEPIKLYGSERTTPQTNRTTPNQPNYTERTALYLTDRTTPKRPNYTEPTLKKILFIILTIAVR